MNRSAHIVRSKIAAFRQQGFNVHVTQTPQLVVRVEDRHRCYLRLSGSEAASFMGVVNKLAEIHALSLPDACRLQGFRALQAHLQISLPLDTPGHRSERSQRSGRARR